MIFENMIQDHKLLICHYYSFFCRHARYRKIDLLQAAIRQVMKRKRSVLIACPQATLHSPTRLDCVFSDCNAHYFTGSLYVLQAIFGDDATCGTVHSAFYIQFDGKDDDDDNSQQFTNWSFSKFDCIILDEVSMISFRHSCHILDTLNSLSIFPLTILCGDNRQLKALAKQDGHIRTVRNLFDNH